MTGTKHGLHGGQGVILALDVYSIDQAKALLERTAPFIAAIKIGWTLMVGCPEGPRIVESIAKLTSLPILVDTKILDAPHIAKRMIALFRDQGASAVTMWASAGPKTVSACMEEFPEIDLFLLTALTAAESLQASDSISSALATANLCGCKNLQVPGNYPNLVRSVRQQVGESACLVACGIGAQGGEPGDAAEAGADYEIVGRNIYEAPDPTAVAKEYRDLI